MGLFYFGANVHQAIKKEQIYFQDGEQERLSKEDKRAVVLDEHMRTLLHEFRLIADDMQRKASENCVFTKPEQRVTKRLCGTACDLGDGNPDRGINTIKDSIRFIDRRRAREDELVKKGLFTAISIIVTAICFAVWKTIKG